MSLLYIVPLQPPIFTQDRQFVTVFGVKHILPIKDRIDDSLVLHWRAMCQKLFDTMEEDDLDNNWLVSGATGIGKTLATWVWVCDYAKRHPEERIVWWSMELDMIVILLQGRMRELTTKSHDFQLMDKDLLIVDGLKVNNYQDVLRYYCLRTELKKFILVSTTHFELKEDECTRLRGKQFLFEHWTLPEYMASVANPYFFECIRHKLGADLTLDYLFDETKREVLQELLETKFFYAGFNARWMFDTNIEEVKNIIRTAIHQTIIKEDLYRGLLGVRKESTVNLLCMTEHQYLNHGGVFASGFVLYELALCVDKNFMANLINYSSKVRRYDAMFDEWVLKSHVLFNLKHNTLAQRVYHLNMPDPSSGTETAEIISETADYSFMTRVIVRIDEMKIDEEILVGTWFLPDFWCHAGYDFVQLIQVDNIFTLRFVQVRLSPIIQIRLHYMRKFVNYFNFGRNKDSNPPPVNKVEILVLTTADNAINYANYTPEIFGLDMLPWNPKDLKIAILS